MLDVTKVLIAAVQERAEAHFALLFGASAPRGPIDFVLEVAHNALGAISGSDALYHNMEHTTHVTLVGLEILKARALRDDDRNASSWANAVVAMLCHDIGYVSGLCRGDNSVSLATGPDGGKLKHVSGCSDAVLMPIHVNRGKLYVEENFLTNPHADIGFINACIERTRFPVPDDAWYQQTDDFPGLVRAADLIGQLSDPRYLNKLSAIFFEFEETGFNQATGYACPGDLMAAYPQFFETSVRPYIGPATELLESSDEGRDILAHLFANLDTAEASITTTLATAANS